jgi:hypothetical protein
MLREGLGRAEAFSTYEDTFGVSRKWIVLFSTFENVSSRVLPLNGVVAYCGCVAG